MSGYHSSPVVAAMRVEAILRMHRRLTARIEAERDRTVRRESAQQGNAYFEVTYARREERP